MVAQYLPTLCAALTDSSPLIRRQTLTLLTRLLTEDFVKLREALLFNLLRMLVDEEQSVRQLGMLGSAYADISCLHTVAMLILPCL